MQSHLKFNIIRITIKHDAMMKKSNEMKTYRDSGRVETGKRTFCEWASEHGFELSRSQRYPYVTMEFGIKKC